jgi:hypothetical protein
MFDWLFEGHIAVYAVLAAAAAVCTLLWRRTRKRRWLAGAAAALALAGLYALLDFAVETDRERLQRLIPEMAAGLKPHSNLDPVFDHVSEQFRSPSGKSKSEVRETARSYLDSGVVTEVKVWNVRVEKASRREGTAEVLFDGKVKGNLGGGEYLALWCKAVFEYDPARGWLLKSLEVHPQGAPDEAFPGY